MLRHSYHAYGMQDNWWMVDRNAASFKFEKIVCRLIRACSHGYPRLSALRGEGDKYPWVLARFRLQVAGMTGSSIEESRATQSSEGSVILNYGRTRPRVRARMPAIMAESPIPESRLPLVSIGEEMTLHQQ